MTEIDNDILQENTADEELLDAFFAQSRSMQVPDEGFSRRVMRRIPEPVPLRQRRASALWTAACTLVCLVAFFANDGVALLKQGFSSSLGSVAAAVSQSVPKVDLSALLPVALPDNALYTVPLVAVGVMTLAAVVGIYGVMQSE